MSRAFDLKRVPAPPPPPEPKVCVACKGFRAECVVPVGESSAPMCWLCAHHVVDHECPPHKAATAECECTPDQIYPGREAPLRFEHGDVTREMIEGATKEELLRGSSFSDACAERAREIVENMPEHQRAFLLSGAKHTSAVRGRGGYTTGATMSGLKMKIWCSDEEKSTPVAAVTQHAARRKAP